MDNPKFEAVVQRERIAFAERMGDLHRVANGENEASLWKMFPNQRDPQWHQATHARVFDKRALTSKFLDQQSNQLLPEPASRRALKMFFTQWLGVLPIGTDGVQEFVVEFYQLDVF